MSGWLTFILQLVAAIATAVLLTYLLRSRAYGWRQWGVRLGSALAGLALVVQLRLMLYPLFGGKELILRMVGAAVLSFLAVVLLSPRTIRFLIRKKLGDRPEFDHAALNELTRHKSATPTMGGILIIPAILVSIIVFGNIGEMYVRMAMLVLIWLGLLGGIDDYLKLRASSAVAGGEPAPSRDGLRMWEKLLFQLALAVLLAIFIYSHGRESQYIHPEYGTFNAVHFLNFPFKAHPIYLPLAVYVIVAVLVMVGSSNAVNLTDGMDGLASGCMVLVTAVFLLLSWVAGNHHWATFLHVPFVPQAAELTVVCAALIGSCLGFLWYNSLPAQIFMGDTGSLPLGGLLGYIAIVTRQELLLIIAGGVFVMEAASVMLQIGYFKSTGGRRLFRCAPIHHHFHLLGWAESKVVVRFWLLGMLLAAIALATLKLR